MQAWFDKMQAELADAIDPTTNTVGHFVKQIYNFAQGGLADNSETSDMGLIQRIVNAANKSTTGADATVVGGKYGDSPLGHGFTNSPPYIAQHYTQLSKFFSGAPAGNQYTDRFTTPQKTDAPKSQDPNVFYHSWYNRMRQFAEAAEIADRGQTTVRSR